MDDDCRHDGEGGTATPRGYEDILALHAQLRRPVTALLALAPGNDPFYAGQPGRREKAEWFAAVWQASGMQECHNRRLHYYLVNLPDPPRKPDGMPYANTRQDWELLEMASKSARCLGLVPAEAITDRRNPEALTPDGWGVALQTPGHAWYAFLHEWALPALNAWEVETSFDFPAPHLVGYDYTEMAQPFHVEVWIEKSTMNDILAPLCEELFCVLSPAIGFASMTRSIEILRRIAAVQKPTRIFTISDCDPAGGCMPGSVARQLEYWLDKLEIEADVRLTSLVLTPAQVLAYGLPKIPIKDSDARKGNFERRYGVGATELDALEAIYPGELERLVRQAVAPYRDPTLRTAFAARRAAASQAMQQQWVAATLPLRQAMEAFDQAVREAIAPLTEEYADLAARFAETLEPFEERLSALQRVLARAKADFHPTLPALPVSHAMPDEADDWLFDSRRSYLAQLPAFSAKYPPVHVPGKGPQSLAGAPLPGDAQGRSGH